MFDKSHFSKEQQRLSPEAAERLRARWSVVYHAVEAIHASEIAEHGAGLMHPEAIPQSSATNVALASPVTKREAVQAAQVGGNVFNLEAYREQRQQTAEEVEAMGRQRLAEQARLNAEAAFQEGEEYHGQLAA